MSLPLFLVQALPASDEYTLDGPEGRHAATVQRLRVGEELLIGDGAGQVARARVKSAEKTWLEISIIERWRRERPEPRVTVAQGIAKGDRGELAVQAMTEVGVDGIIPWAAARSVAQWRGERGAKSLQKWESTAREAAKQARRAWLPTLEAEMNTRQLAARLGPAALVLHEEAKESLSTVELPASGEIVLVIGPEGGIDTSELAAFEQRGARVVRLGDNVLRTSTAGVAALSVLAVRLGRW